METKNWIKKNWKALLGSAIPASIIIVEAIVLSKVKSENKKLQDENLELRGQITAGERENRRLSRENGNLNYQLGKLVAKRN